MRHVTKLFGLVGLAVIGCGGDDGGSSNSGSALSKEQARAVGGTSDKGADLCKKFGWYGDGLCDDFCPSPDPDCKEPTPSCGGIAGLTCPSGQKCVDDPNDGCDPTHGGADCGGICVEDSPTPTMCGGFANLPCPSGQKCVDDPDDGCDPNNGGADCGGICVDDAPTKPEQCGGFAGTPCPDGKNCVDDPSDDCDPANGGADCMGICVAP